MSDIMKMDELLANYQRSRPAEAVPVAVQAAPAVSRRSVIVAAAVLYAVAAVGMLSYAFWVAAHFGK